MKKILEFLSENFQFLVVKFSVCLNRRVFLMICLFAHKHYRNSMDHLAVNLIPEVIFENKIQKQKR